MGIKEFWTVARKRPVTALALVLLWIASTIGWEVIHPKLLALLQPPPPFSHLGGEYTGTIYGSGQFDLCFVEDEAHPSTHEYDVRGTMLFASGAYVDYKGSTSGNRLDMKYARGGNSAVSDNGTATFYAPKSGKGPVEGYYVSKRFPENRQNLMLTKIAGNCRLANWGQGW